MRHFQPRHLILGIACLILFTGAGCSKMLFQPNTGAIQDAPQGSIVGHCARDGRDLVISTCPNCSAGCDYTLTQEFFTCNQCGRAFSAVTCSCKTNTFISSGRFRIKQ